MKASDWIDKVKTARGWESDYRVAKELCISRQAVSDYRSRTPSMDEATAIKVASILGEKPEAVLLDQFAERTKNQDVKEVLQQMARRLCILCKVKKTIKTIATRARPACASAGFR